MSILARMHELTIFGKHPLGVYLRVNEWIYNHLPLCLISSGPVASYRKFLDSLTPFQRTKGIGQYIVSVSSSPSFTGKGLVGYPFERLKNRDLEFCLIQVEKGHDTFQISKRIIRTYYVLEGKGYFTIENQNYNVEPGVLVEVPPKVEYSYSGTMKLLLISRPRLFEGNDKSTRLNPDVFDGT
jgi:mannose-6-phosphate isomerase-like protein (cupin superfamily)